MQQLLQIMAAAVVLATATTAQAQMRFQGMDANGDGRADSLDNQIAQRFSGYDMNSDNRVGRSEWPGDPRLFTRLDANSDGYLSMQEYSKGGGFTLDSLGGASYRFSNIDVNGDGLITRNEWNMNSADFNRLDMNRDNRVSRFEFENDTAAHHDYRRSAAQFNAFDTNRDGWLTRTESGMRTGEFDRLDHNGDNRVSRFEFENGSTASDTADGRNRSAAWRTGYDRGIQEGRDAGREDFTRHQGWDLEGQRELEQADSGYTPQMGTLSDYQAGYREGFMSAYRAGFVEAGGTPPRR